MSNVSKPAVQPNVTPTTRPVKEDWAKPGPFGTIQSGVSTLIAKDTPLKVGRAARAARGGAQVGVNTGAGMAGFIGAFLGGLKLNAAIAFSISFVSNIYDALHGRSTMKQFLGLLAADTVAYTAIGCTAAGVMTLVPGLMAMVPPLAFLTPVATFLLPIGAGLALSWGYGKLVHEPLKQALR